MIEEALALFKEIDDQPGQALAINYLTRTTVGYLERVTTLCEEAEALLEQPVEDRRAAANLQLSLGMLALIPLDHERVVLRAGESLALFREEEDLRSCAQCF